MKNHNKNILINLVPNLYWVIFWVMIVFALSINAQDTIYSKNGNVIQAKVYEITQTAIHFQKVSNLEGPMYTIDKNEVTLIHYKNGSKDVFSGNASTTLAPQDTRQNDDVYNTQNSYQQNQQQVVQQNQAMVSNYYNSNTAANLAAINYMMSMQSMMMNYGYGNNYGYSYWPYSLHNYGLFNPYRMYNYSPLGNLYYGRGWRNNGGYHNTYGGFHGGGHHR